MQWTQWTDLLRDWPNRLTVARVLLIIPLVVCLWLPGGFFAWLAMLLFLAAAITDWLDGWLARRDGTHSPLGQMLDPIADKLLVVATIVMLAFDGRIGDLTILPALVILMREILVAGLREFLAGLAVAVPVTQLAKVKTAMQLAALPFLIIAPHAPDGMPALLLGVVLLWAAALLTLRTGADYLLATLERLRPPSDTP